MPCRASQGLMKLTGPRADWRSEDDCGTVTYSAPGNRTIPLNCAGAEWRSWHDHACVLVFVSRGLRVCYCATYLPSCMVACGQLYCERMRPVAKASAQQGGFKPRRHAPPATIRTAGSKKAFFQDLDGTLFKDLGGKASTLAGFFGSTPRAAVDQGTPIAPGTCTFNSIFGGYSCPNSAAPTPFVLESRDADRDTRDFSPVTFNVSGSVDVVVPVMDNVSGASSGWVGMPAVGWAEEAL